MPSTTTQTRVKWSLQLSVRWDILDTMATSPARSAAFGAGCYEASRAAALAGVPTRTVYDWATKGLVVPSISPDKEKLWSYADLMALRIVAWLRHPKGQSSSDRLPASPMAQVREALDQLDRMRIDLWAASRPPTSSLVVDQRGAIFIRVSEDFVDLQGNSALPHEERFGLLGPFDREGHHAPDLIQPRPHLRIVPERVAGEPHVAGTRLTTPTLAALSLRGFTNDQIAAMYDVPAEVVAESIDLETQLQAA